MSTSKEKGDLLEKIVHQMCSGIKNAKVKRNARITGRNTSTKRDIDVLIEGKIGVVDVRIAVEAKNYGKPIGVEKVESLITKLDDIGANVGVMVSQLGFTKPARKLATSKAIRLFSVFDPSLGNSPWLIPLRMVKMDIGSFQFRFKHEGGGSGIYLSGDNSDWLFYIDDKILNFRQLVLTAWNKNMIPHEEGEHIANFNAVKMGDRRDPKQIRYCELNVAIKVVGKYFLKYFPTSFLKDLQNKKENHSIYIDDYSQDTEMIAHGWIKFDSLEEMNKASEIDNQPEGIKNMIIYPDFTYSIDGVT